jgi:glucoamylase
MGWGKGRAWPILTGERAHYELAAGRAAAPYIKAMEKFASRGGMLPEQSWDERDMPEHRLFLGRPTGAAMPLLWAHAEYVKLLRSVTDGKVFDRIEPVAARYLEGKGRKDLEVWKFNRQPRKILAGMTLRVIAHAAFRLRWTADEWTRTAETASRLTALGLHFADVAVSDAQRAPLKFTFYWPDARRWEGRDFEVTCDADGNGRAGTHGRKHGKAPVARQA